MLLKVHMVTKLDILKPRTFQGNINVLLQNVVQCYSTIRKVIQKSSLTPLTNLSKVIAMVDSPVTRLSNSGIVSLLLTVGDIHSIPVLELNFQETCHGSLNHGISQTHGFVTLTV